MSFGIKFECEFILFNFLYNLLDEAEFAGYTIDTFYIEASAIYLEYRTLNSQAGGNNEKR